MRDTLAGFSAAAQFNVNIPPAVCRVGCAGAAGRGAQQRSFTDGWGSLADAQRAAGSGVALCPHPCRLSDYMLLSPAFCDTCLLTVLPARSLRCLPARHMGYQAPCALQTGGDLEEAEAAGVERSGAQAAHGGRQQPAAQAGVPSEGPHGARSQQDQGTPSGQPCDAAPQVGANIVHCWLDHGELDAHCLVLESQLLCSVALSAAHGCWMRR